jgi:hypothetical protein
LVESSFVEALLAADRGDERLMLIWGRSCCPEHQVLEGGRTRSFGLLVLRADDR